MLEHKLQRKQNVSISQRSFYSRYSGFTFDNQQSPVSTVNFHFSRPTLHYGISMPARLLISRNISRGHALISDGTLIKTAILSKLSEQGNSIMYQNE